MDFLDRTIKKTGGTLVFIGLSIYISLLFSGFIAAFLSKNENILLKNLSNWSTLFGSVAVIVAAGMYFFQHSQQQKLDFQRTADLVLNFYKNAVDFWKEAELLPPPDDPLREIKHSIWQMKGIANLIEAEMILRQIEKYKGLTGEEKEIISNYLKDGVNGTVRIIKIFKSTEAPFHTNGMPRVTNLLNEGE
ncbi:hypothetical protein [Geothrix sp. 21YS21S-4]|uniref:hypothetical protein n=1 Tax=Geothrix sp. 21YS21S-4 TaxID=3068889 RepID=UPI0027B97B60|nr:hypothetical protein [Geothrix sp. 21YS21S-4]